ncbi:hypothetical protein K7432_005888 [Basidiobolus ranarum]|uniref:Uncharacterized protein n=1 Tax=Basidiobolus ranarum TaxID=34480 RepID=A0ABR2WVX3_9FUNG
MNSPEETILACAKYLRANESRFRNHKGKPPINHDNDPSLTSSLTSVLTLGYVRPVSTPSERTFTVDPVKLSIVITKLEEYNLLVDGVPQVAPMSPARSVKSVTSLASITSSFSSLSFLGWKRNENSGIDAKIHFQNELEYICRFFQHIRKLRISWLDANQITQHDNLPVPISLGPFIGLVHLDLQKLPPRYFSAWNILHLNLESIVCQGGIVDLHDLFIDTIGKDASLELDATWPKLHSIDLSHNDLAGLAVEPALRITACETLNISHNLLLSVPPALTELFRLRNLNLSHNMISNVTGIDQILGNITVLDLSYNRLVSLCGLHKLWALVLINVRGNEISDVGEVGRLAELPSLQEVLVEGNPLTQKADYRTQIFSIFFSHELDILLDGTGPSFLEKRSIITEPKAGPGEEPIIAIRPVATYTPISNSSTPPETKESSDIPALKSRRNRPAFNKNKRRSKRVVDISSDQDPLDSIAESPKLLESSLSGKLSESIMTEEPEGMSNENIPRSSPRSASQILSTGEITSHRTDKPFLHRSTSPNRQGKPFVHRLAELEGVIQTGRHEFRIPIRGRSIQRDSQPSSPRSRSPASIRSSMSALTATNNSEDFRKKIEALRNEAGSTWLKIYSEIQHPTNVARRRSIADSQDPEDDKFVVGSLPSKLTLVSLRKSKANEPTGDSEVVEDDLRSVDSPSSTDSKKSNNMVESTTPVLAESQTELVESEEVTEPESELKSLPDGKQYRIQVTEYSSRTRSKRCVRVPIRDRILVITDTTFVEANPETWDIVCQRGFQGLLRIETKRVETPEQHAVFRLEFKYRRYDNPTYCDYRITRTAEDPKISEELQTELETIVRKNWEEGKGHEVYKQGKCLNCSWIGFLNLEDEKDNGDWLRVKKLNNSLSPVTSESESDAKEKERKCPVCSGTFLVEFFGREESGVTQTNEPPAWAFTSSSHVTDSDSPVNNKFGFFDSWLANPLVGLTNRNDTKSPVKARALSPMPNQDAKELKKKKSEINETEILKKMEQVAGYSASLPPFRSLTNAIRLHFQLTIIEDDDERLVTWVSSSFIPHAPTSVTLPSMWSIMSSNIENIPKVAPVEKPIYIGLTNKTLYLFSPQTIPLPASTSATENNPAKHLKLLYAIPISLVSRIDVGPNRQTLTVHLNLASYNGATSVPATVSLTLPPHSITFLIRDRLICSAFLNSLVEICYDYDIHMEEGKVKVVNHDIEWAVKNIRKQVLINEMDSRLEAIPNHYLTGVDPASSEAVVVDKVTFDFFKIYHLVTRLLKQPVSSPPVADSPQYYTEAFTLVGTEKYLYLCQERHDVWPPAITNISEIMDTTQNSPTIQKAEGRWGRKKNHPLMATLIEQYKRVEVIPISWITEVEKIKKGTSMIIGKEKEGPNVGCAATGWEVLIRITFSEEIEELDSRSNRSVQSTITLQNPPPTLEEKEGQPVSDENHSGVDTIAKATELDTNQDTNLVADSTPEKATAEEKPEIEVPNTNQESEHSDEQISQNEPNSETTKEENRANDEQNVISSDGNVVEVSEKKPEDSPNDEVKPPNHNEKSSKHISWNLLYTTQASAEEFIENLRGVWKETKGAELNVLE